MPGTSAGLNHSLDIHACGRSRMSLRLELFVQSAETILEPGAFDLDPQAAKPLLEQHPGRLHDRQQPLFLVVAKFADLGRPAGQGVAPSSA